MSENYAVTVIEGEIPIADMTTLERLVLGSMFTCEEADEGRVRFYAEEGAADWVSPDPVVLAAARRDSASIPSRLNAYIDQTLALYCADPAVEVEIDMTGLCWESILQDIVRRSPTLRYVSTSTAFTCSKMTAGGFGGAASVVTADAVWSQSTHAFIENRIAKIEAASGDVGA